jgi:hypothetical protein
VGEAIRELFIPVANSVIPITMNAARCLILKDYAYERDEHKFVRAIKSVTGHLTENLALLTCREPLLELLPRIMRLSLLNLIYYTKFDTTSVPKPFKIHELPQPTLKELAYALKGHKQLI